MQGIKQFHKMLDEAVDYIKNQMVLKPRFGVILGTGLG